MKTLIEDLKKVINSDIEDKDKYLEKLIKGFLRERDCEVLKNKEKPTPLNWLLHDKLGIEKGSTYIEPKITIRQCASYISEYMKKYFGNE